MFDTLAANTNIDTAYGARLEAVKNDAESLKPSCLNPNKHGSDATPMTLIALDSANIQG